MAELLNKIQSCKQCCEPFSKIKSQFHKRVKNIHTEFNSKLAELNRTILFINSHLNELVQLSTDWQIDYNSYISVDDTHEAEAGFKPSNNHQSPLETYIDKEVTDISVSGLNSKQTPQVKLKISTKPSKCHECGAMQQTGRQLISHLVNVHGHEKPIPCHICPKRFMDQSNMRHHLLTHKRPQKEGYICDICPMVFMGRSAFVSHRRTHTGEGAFECDKCQKKFAQKTGLISHIRLHTGERPYTCDVCSKTFRHKPALRCHARKHTGERPFRCPMCDRSFFVKATLDVHVLTHTGERPHTCPICKKGYTKRYLVKIHLKNMHNIDDVESVYPKLKKRSNRINSDPIS